jgi:hypothetical protein
MFVEPEEGFKAACQKLGGCDAENVAEFELECRHFASEKSLAEPCTRPPG